tara:strand:+ start:91 stop:576 length:486 start_codon:yes stop_codon:yes gene_type:complete
MRRLTKEEAERLTNITSNEDELKNAALIHISATMLEKNIIDANKDVRKLLRDYNKVDYDDLGKGQSMSLDGHYVMYGTHINGEKVPDNILFIGTCKISVYRASGRGDYRIWFKDLKKYCNPNEIMLLRVHTCSKLVLYNLSSDRPAYIGDSGNVSVTNVSL